MEVVVPKRRSCEGGRWDNYVHVVPWKQGSPKGDHGGEAVGRYAWDASHGEEAMGIIICMG